MKSRNLDWVLQFIFILPSPDNIPFPSITRPLWVGVEEKDEVGEEDGVEERVGVEEEDEVGEEDGVEERA